MAIAEGGIAEAIIVHVWLEGLKALDEIKAVVIDCGTGAGNCQGREGSEQELEGHVGFWFWGRGMMGLRRIEDVV